MMAKKENHMLVESILCLKLQLKEEVLPAK
jgi:hypothetical protein